MKQKLLTLLLFTSFTLISQTNLAPNGDMEEWDSFDSNPKEWYRFSDGLWRKNSDAQNGNASLELEVAPGRDFNFIFTPDIQFTTGITYKCTVYYKVLSGTFSKVEFNLVHTPSVFPERLVSNEFTDFSTTIWKKAEFEYTATSTEEIQGYIYVYSAAGSKILIDNVSIIDKSTLSTSDELSTESIKFNIYPNPSNNFIQVLGIEGKEEYTVYDFLGKKVSTGEVSKEEQIDVKNLTNGIYLLKTEKGKVSRFIKE